MEADSEQGEVNLAPFFLSELKMVSRSARAAYLSVGTLVVPLSRSFAPLGVPAVEELLWLWDWEEELKHPKSTLRNLGKW